MILLVKKVRVWKKLFNMYEKLGFKKVLFNLYPNMRHEILNEKEKMVVYNDVLEFFKFNKVMQEFIG